MADCDFVTDMGHRTRRAAGPSSVSPAAARSGWSPNWACSTTPAARPGWPRCSRTSAWPRSATPPASAQGRRGPATVPPPSASELAAVRSVDPLRVRKSEFSARAGQDFDQGTAGVPEPRAARMLKRAGGGVHPSPGRLGRGVGTGRHRWRLLWDNLATSPVRGCRSGRRPGSAAGPPRPERRAWPHRPGRARHPGRRRPRRRPGRGREGRAAVVILSAGFAETGGHGARCRTKRWPPPGGRDAAGRPQRSGVQNSDLPLNASIAPARRAAAAGSASSPSPGRTGWPRMRWARTSACGWPRCSRRATRRTSPITRCSPICGGPGTGVICLLLESITHARGFFAEGCMTTPHKPVIAGVGGRQAPGSGPRFSHRRGGQRRRGP